MRLALCALVLAGCYDFSRFEHLPDAAGLDGAGGGMVLVDEPFNAVIDWTKWDSGVASHDDFSFDPLTSMDKNGSMRVDVTALAAGQGALSWIGSALPTTPGSLHLRFYAAYDMDIPYSVDLGSLASGDGTGVAVTLNPVDPTMPVAGAEVVLKQLPNTLTNSNVVVNSPSFHCYELGVELLPDGTQWQAALQIDGQAASATANPSSIGGQPATLQVGFAIPQLGIAGATAAWIDAVMLTSGDATIGCPY